MKDLPLTALQNDLARRAYTMHDRNWRNNRYVYPVVSRRSKGISLGINLNPDKVCNFDCIYCSVDRKEPSAITEIDLQVLQSELHDMLEWVRSGEIYKIDPFSTIPAPLRRLNDIAFSGDGEPTTAAEFPEACKLAAELKEKAGLHEVKLIVISNATMFHRPAVEQALGFLDQHQGEIWAKLDAGTPEYFDLVDRSPVSFDRILENIHRCALIRPTVIQSLFMKVHDEVPSAKEIAAYAERLFDIRSAGGKLKLIQLYTVARQTTEAYVAPLNLSELTAISGQVKEKLNDVPIEVYP